ncbi:hypothetical protein CUR83_08405 [Psychrobacter pocilloporae]|jgi:hypothetical protein|uniref:Uncharacterized protein n=1 Tax=Psychrobacter pocilloporae TaxID=1775882 RepID=A0ABT6ITC7_9GAMM|nr:hypothetical protein AOT82_709 [Psychrobacter sp. AntiMn-1]MDH4905076.1 hypothetical protein [Psychrobacter pocilloporae]
MMKRIFLILFLLIVVASFFYFDLNQLLTLEGLKGLMAQFDAYKTQSPLLIIDYWWIIFTLCGRHCSFLT